MTTTDFQQRFPKPWKFVMNETTFSLRAANGANVALLSLTSSHSGIPQREWNRHIAAALKEHIEVTEGNGSGWGAATVAREGQCRSATGRWVRGTASATPATQSTEPGQ